MSETRLTKEEVLTKIAESYKALDELYEAGYVKAIVFIAETEDDTVQQTDGEASTLLGLMLLASKEVEIGAMAMRMMQNDLVCPS